MKGEPVKYEQWVNSKGTKAWRITQEWKDWKNQMTKTKAKPKTTISAESHQPRWKEVAWFNGSTRRILFCACRSNQGASYAGCGAVAIKNTPQSEPVVVVEPRFE